VLPFKPRKIAKRKKGAGVVFQSAQGREFGLSCDEVIKGAQEAGQKVSLREKNVRYCTGCGNFLESAKEMGVIYGTGAWNQGDIKKSRAMTQAYEMGKRI
jgi:hypothetical protein